MSISIPYMYELRNGVSELSAAISKPNARINSGDIFMEANAIRSSLPAGSNMFVMMLKYMARTARTMVNNSQFCFRLYMKRCLFIMIAICSIA